MKDVGQVHDGWLVQQNIVRENGRRSVLLSIIKNGNASTLDVVNAVKEALKTARAAAPAGLEINELFDQSVFVKHSVAGVLREGAIAAGLTALMILLFLGSWRSTLVVMISIPLAILTSLVVLYFLGETLNTMTLGGLALAVGILVDDSTVTIENTHRLLTEEQHAAAGGDAARRRRHRRADTGLDARHQLRVHLGGLPRRPGEIPVHAARPRGRVRHAGVLRPVADADADHHRPAAQGRAPWRRGRWLRGTWFARLHAPSSAASSSMRDGYAALLTSLLHAGFIVPIVGRPGARARRRPCSCSSAAISFRPSTAARSSFTSARRPAPGSKPPNGSSRPSRTRSARSFRRANGELIVDNIGLPARAYNLAFTDGSTIGVNDGVILVALKEGHAPTADYVRKLREVLPAAFPEVLFYFQAADIVTQILNFGLPAQIDVRTVGYDRANNLRVAKELRQRIAAIPGIVDAHLQQEVDAPAFYATIDRARAAQLGLNANTIATNVNVSLSSSEQVTPNFWTDPTSGIPYYLAVQTPEHKVSFAERSRQHAGFDGDRLDGAGVPVPGLLSNVATFKRDSVPTNTNQTNIQPVYEVYASVQGRDLGSVSDAISKIVADLQKQLTPGNSIQVIGPDPEHERRLPRISASASCSPPCSSTCSWS